MDAGITRLEAAIAGIEEGLAGIHERLDTMNRRVNILEASIIAQTFAIGALAIVILTRI